MVHQKEDFITFKGKYYRCICADKQIAVFARVTPHRADAGYRTNMQDLFACGQDDSLDCERIYRGAFTFIFPKPKRKLAA